MGHRRTVLIADPDAHTLRELERALCSDYQILVARDGSKALELAVLNYPDLIFFHRSCPLIGATQFLRILRTNPRTEEIPLIVLSDDPVVGSAVPGFLEGVLVKPLNLDEVRAHVAAVFRRSDAAKEVGQGEGAVSGDLGHISMIDLLQVFSMNRRTGALQVQRQDAALAEVFVHDGRVEEAVVGTARGEKALFRLVTWEEGRFTFVPGRRAPTVSIRESTDGLIMEALRHDDELARLRPELPASDATLERLISADDVPAGLHPVTAELLDLVTYYPRVAELIDRARAGDLEVHQALRALLQAGLVRVVAPALPSAPQRLFTNDEVLELRTRLRRAGLSLTYQGCPKLAVVASDPARLRAWLSAAGRWTEFRGADFAYGQRPAYGPLGAFELAQGFVLEVYGLCAEERLLPLAFATSAGTVAAVVLGTGELSALGAMLQLLEEERRAALVFLRLPGEPAAPVGKRRVMVEAGRIDEDQVRHVLHAVLKHAASADLRGVSL